MKKTLTDKIKEINYLGRAKAGDVEAREIFTDNNFRIAIYIARRFENTRLDFDDVIKCAFKAFDKAIDLYVIGSNRSFDNFAARIIEDAIIEELEMVLNKEKKSTIIEVEDKNQMSTPLLQSENETNSLTLCALTAEELESCLLKAKLGDEASLLLLFANFVSVSQHIPSEIRGYVSPDDYSKCGMQGLEKAVVSYDMESKVPFYSYAVECIIDEISKFGNNEFEGKRK